MKGYPGFAQYQHVVIWEVKCSLEGLLSAEKINGWMFDLLLSSNQQNSNEIQQKGIPC